MSKKILEDIKNLPQSERLELYKQLGPLMTYDGDKASQGIDPGTGFHDDYITKAYGGQGKKVEPVAEKVEDSEKTEEQE